MAPTFNPVTFNAGEPLSVDKLNQLNESISSIYTTASDLQNQNANIKFKVSLAGYATFSNLTKATNQTINLDASNLEGNPGRYVFSAKPSTPLTAGTVITITQTSDTQALLTTNSDKTIGGEVNYIAFTVG